MPTGAPLPPDADLAPALEAVLMVVENPVQDTVLAEVLQRPVTEVREVLRGLSAEYTAQGRGFDLRQVAGGWRFYTRPEQAPAVERFVLDGRQARLTQAALETLAVVAYRQPVSRARVSAVRGVNCDAVMRTLLTRGLVSEHGVDPDTGAVLYATTDLFLERMGLEDTAQLPDLAPFLPEVDTVEEETEGAMALVRAARPGEVVTAGVHSGDTGSGDTTAVGVPAPAPPGQGEAAGREHQAGHVPGGRPAPPPPVPTAEQATERAADHDDPDESTTDT